MLSQAKQCQNCKKDFTVESEDFKFYEKIKVPPPTFCPECRLTRRFCWRNERSLYKRTCDLCQKRMISIYDTGVSFPVYCTECWKGDSWDPLEYAQDYNPKQPFFEQWKELFLKVPRQALVQIGDCLDTEYTNLVKDVKDVFLAYSVINSEDVFYSKNIDRSKIVFDSYNTVESELIYENMGGVKNYNCQYAYWSSSCIDCNFTLDCGNCSDCFGCVNLRNKRYCIWNEQYTREEYFEKLKKLNLGSYRFKEETLNKFWGFSLQLPRKYSKITNCTNVTGDELRNCKNTFFAFNAYDLEDTKFVHRCLKTKNSMDICHMDVGELIYEHASGGSGQSSNIKFIINGGLAMSEVEYSDLCQSSSNIFGCIGLKSKQYCILNKQYKKESFDKLRIQIIADMEKNPYIDKKGNVYKYGEFFPFEFSPFGYNETLINDLYPLSEKEIIEKGYNWKEKIESKYNITKKAEDLPDDIKDVDDSILNEVLECTITKKPFKITSFELQFYRRMNIPIPRVHQDERYKRRLALRNPLMLWHRKCMKDGCQNGFETSYAPERPEIVYCERCYNQEVY